MKSLRLLISFSLIIFSSISDAKEMVQDEIYRMAKIAYVKPDCSKTIYFLDKYLKIAKPSKEKLASINSVKQWCHNFLKDGVYMVTIYGFTDPRKSEEHITEAGIEMLKNKPPIPNK